MTLCLPVLLLLAAPLMADVVVFAEDFESVELGPNVDEGAANDQAWSPDGPEGWETEFDLDAEDGVTEWKGWTFADAAWWTQAAGDQDRSKFTNADAGGLAVGTVAVADPDEYDDLNGAAGPGYFTWLRTPPIPLTQVRPTSLTVAFDHSWRPEDTQNARLYVTYDGTNKEHDLLTMVSLGAATEFIAPNDGIDEVLADQLNVNERLELTIKNPAGAKTMIIVWEMTDATNDWWWAIDNIEVTTDAPFAVDAAGKATTTWAEAKKLR